MTDEEYKKASGKVANVQKEVEKPHVYIVARCRSCDVEQLAYVETRLCCLQHLQRNLLTTDGIEIKDICNEYAYMKHWASCGHMASWEQLPRVSAILLA